MVKGIIGYQVLSYQDVEPIFMQLRLHALQYPGFVNSEDLLGEKDSSVVVTISTWDRTEDWKEWENSKIRQQLYHEAEDILEDKPREQMYRILETQRWI